MIDAAQNEMVAKHVLRSSQHLGVALAVYDAYDEIRRRVIEPFISNLKEAVAGELNSTAEQWTVDALVEARPSDDWMGKRDCRLRVRQANWPPGHFAGVGADKFGPTALWFGVWGITGEDVGNGIKAHLDQRVIVGGARRDLNPPVQWHYGFWYLFERRWQLDDWTSTEAIAAMHEGKNGDYHNRIVNMSVRVARAADEFLRPHAVASSQ
jgi:hypothetical protein